MPQLRELALWLNVRTLLGCQKWNTAQKYAQYSAVSSLTKFREINGFLSCCKVRCTDSLMLTRRRWRDLSRVHQVTSFTRLGWLLPHGTMIRKEDALRLHMNFHEIFNETKYSVRCHRSLVVTVTQVLRCRDVWLRSNLPSLGKQILL